MTIVDGASLAKMLHLQGLVAVSWQAAMNFAMYIDTSL
jgi:hypothetical protein